VQSQAPTGRYPLHDGVGIQAVGKAVARDFRSVGSYEQLRRRQELPLSYECMAAVLDRQRIHFEACRKRSYGEFVPEHARRFEQALRLRLQAINLLFDERAQALGDGACDLSNRASQSPAVVFQLQHPKGDKLVHHPRHEERIAVRTLVHSTRQLGRKRMPAEALRQIRGDIRLAQEREGDVLALAPDPQLLDERAEGCPFTMTSTER
jgi:hypothetical protein